MHVKYLCKTMEKYGNPIDITYTCMSFTEYLVARTKYYDVWNNTSSMVIF